MLQIVYWEKADVLKRPQENSTNVIEVGYITDIHVKETVAL